MNELDSKLCEKLGDKFISELYLKFINNKLNFKLKVINKLNYELNKLVYTELCSELKDELNQLYYV
jgi:hypothetical protein